MRSNSYALIAMFTREIRRAVMLDAILVVAGFAFFIIAIAYAVACDRL
jgi:hypothetical protein